MPAANTELAQRWFEEIWNQQRRETIYELLDPHAVLHECGVDTIGPDAFAAYYDRMQATFSDIRITLHQAVEQGEIACVRWSCSLKHTGDGLGVPATGKQVETTGLSMMRVADGRVVEAWQNWDMLGVMQAVGVHQRSANALAVSA